MIFTPIISNFSFRALKFVGGSDVEAIGSNIWNFSDMVRFNISSACLLLLCFASLCDAKYVKYKDPKQPINTRIKDLIDRMTLAEKIGQMTQIERLVASADVMRNCFIGKLSHAHAGCCLGDKNK